MGAAGGSSVYLQYPFSGVGQDAGIEDERFLLAQIVRPAPVLVAGPVDGHVRAVQHDGDFPCGRVQGIIFFRSVSVSTSLINRVILRAVGSTLERTRLDASRDLLMLLWSISNMAASSAWVVPPFLRIRDSSRGCRLYSLEWLPGSDARTSSSQKSVVSPFPLSRRCTCAGCSLTAWRCKA